MKKLADLQGIMPACTKITFVVSHLLVVEK
jgi:hypothetical protein